MSTEPFRRAPLFGVSRWDLGRAFAVLAAVFAWALLVHRGATSAGADSTVDYLTSRPRAAAPAAAPAPVGDFIRTGAGQRRRFALPGGSVLYVDQNSEVHLQAPDKLLQLAGEIFVEARPGQENERYALEVKTPSRLIRATDAEVGVRLEAKGTRVLVTRGQAEVSRGGKGKTLAAGQQMTADSDEPAGAPRASHLLAWTRDLRVAAEAPLVPGSQHAGGALIARDPNGQEAKLSLRKYHIDVHIEDGFARTTIDQTYFNDANWQTEGTFYFPLPPDASLSRLAMYVDGTLMEGGMAERDYARQVYETIRYTQRDPALLEWVDGSTFKMRVFPLEPRQEKRIILSYTQKLPSLYGQATYRFPAGHSLQTVRDLSVHARVKHGAELTWESASHTLKAKKEGSDLVLDFAAKNAKFDRDFVLTVADRALAEEAVRFAAMDHDQARYLMVRYCPKLAARTPSAGRKHWVFLFEASGDRDPLLARVQIDLIREFLTHTDPQDTFTVLAAGTRVRRHAKEPQPASADNIRAAVKFLEGVHLVGALDLGRALTEAAVDLKPAKKNTRPYLVHVGSGIAALGERREEVLAAQIPESARYVGVGVGRRWARGFMKAAAERSGGHFTQVNPDEPIGWRAFDLFATLSTPRLLNVRVVDGSGNAVFLSFAQSVAQGEELCAVARLGPGVKAPAAVTVRGTLEGQAFERVLPVKDVAERAAYLPRTWAKLEIDRLLAENALKHKDQIIALSKAMYVMTPFTSLLVLENEDLYTQYKVDRGRQDHWAMYPCPAKIPVVVEPDPNLPGNLKAPPTAKQVLDTIVVRTSPRLITTGTDTQRLKDEKASRRMMAKAIDAEPGALLFGIGVNDEAGLVGSIALREEGLDAPVQGLTGLARDQRVPSLAKALPAGGVAGVHFRIPAMRPEGAAPTVPALGPPPGRADVIVAAGQLAGRPANFFSGGEQAEPARVGQIIINGNNAARENALRRLAASRSEEWRLGLNLGDSLGNRNELQREAGLAVSDLFADDAQSGKMPGLLYARPSYSDDARLFSDLIAYAPGMNTSLADIEATIEAEAVPSKGRRPGQIDASARELLSQARVRGWQGLTFSGQDGQPAFTIVFDGDSRYAFERVLPLGLKERVVCDGKTLLLLYPDLAVGARRGVSRFHRSDFWAVVPWAVPPAEDLARGADLKIVGDRTVAVVPHYEATLLKASKKTQGADAPRSPEGAPRSPSWVRLHLVFGGDGRLAERQLVHMPKQEVVYRELIAPEGVVRVVDGKGKELAVRKATLREAAAPNLAPDTKKLVVLSLPYRTADHVKRTLKLEKTPIQTLRFQDALPLFAAEMATGNTNNAVAIFQQVFHARDQRQLGLYVLLAACGANLDGQNVDVLAEHVDEPLAHYLALHSSPVLRKHTSQWAAGSGQWGQGFLNHLGVSHALYQRWQSDRVLKVSADKRQAERQRALEYVRRNRGSVFGWVLLTLLQDRAGKDADFHRELVEAWPLFEEVPGLAYAARYEHARSLWKSGQQPESRRRFRELYEATLKEDRLPAIDPDFRRALLGEGADDPWSDLLRTTADRLIEQKHRPAVLALAWQCWQLDDQPLANHLLDTALRRIADDKERTAMTLAGIDFLSHTAQLPQADQLLRGLLADPKLARRASLWRIGTKLAERRELTARELECLEHALDAEYRKLPAVIDLNQVRQEYGKLLGHYQNLADAMVTLKIQPPPDFVARVVRAGDCWRALDHDGTAACQAVARIVQKLGDRDLSWDYLTTPVGLKPNEAAPWLDLAGTLSRQGDLELADRAFAAAYAAEPTNAQILWDRAQNLRQAGKMLEAQQLFRQIAEGRWQPRFQGLQSQARLQLMKD
jgi:tetratricopeptide (TPR) repeat protein